MPSTTKLTDLLAEMRDLDSIERGEVSPRELANRAFAIAPGFVVPRGYTHDNLDQAVAEASWEEEADAPENLAAVAEWCGHSDHLLPPRPPPEPEPEPPLPEPDPPPSGPRSIFQAVRRRLVR